METTALPESSLVASPELDALVAQRTQELQAALDLATQRFNQAPCGHLILDADLHISDINQTLLDWLGYAREELIDADGIGALMSPDSYREMQPSLPALLGSDDSGSVEIELMCKDGSLVAALLFSTTVRDADGQILKCNATVVKRKAQPDHGKSAKKEEGLLQSFTDHLTTRLAYYDKDLICRFSNAAHAERYGKQSGELIGTHLSDVVLPDLMPEILPRVAETLSGKLQVFDTQRDNKDGSCSFFEIRYIPDFQGSSVEGIFIEVRDITERRRTEEFVLEANRDLEERVRERGEELYQSEQRYRLMVDAIQDHCIYFVDEEGAVTEWTESAQRLHGHERNQMLGRPYQSLLATGNAGEDEVDPGQVLRLAKAHGQWETRGWRLRDDGSRFWAHTVLTALRSETGELQGLSSITRDMTAAKSLEDVMNDLNKELEKRVAERTQQLVAANKDLDVFSHMVSHDLRAPLRHISSFVTLLQEQLGDSSDRLTLQYLNSTAKASRRMSHMIEGLLEYARLGRVTLDSQPVPLAPLLDGVIAHLKMENPDRQIEWVVEEDLPVVRGDAMLLAQAWGNLLNNSVKYTRTREAGRIEVGWKVNPVGGRTFFVRDNGVGFDLEKAHNLFVMFQRQHHSMDFDGTGTGLALSQRIVERHGGRIWAETAPDEGCTFYFTLPFEGTEPELEFPASSMAELAY